MERLGKPFYFPTSGNIFIDEDVILYSFGKITYSQFNNADNLTPSIRCEHLTVDVYLNISLALENKWKIN